MNINKWFGAVATAALMAGTTGALAQQEPPRGAPAEKIAPKSPGSAPVGAPGAAQGGGALHNGGAEPNRRNAPEQRGDRINPNRAGEVQPNHGRGETTGQAP